jgi:hypothetical protein
MLDLDGDGSTQPGPRPLVASRDTSQLVVVVGADGEDKVGTNRQALM